MLSLFINLDISPEIFNLGGISIRYYGLLFAVAFILGYKVEEKMFKSEGLPMAWLDTVSYTHLDVYKRQGVDWKVGERKFRLFFRDGK